MAKATKQTYTLMVKINLDLGVKISADSLENAIAQGRELGVEDVINFDHDYNDGSIKLSGAYLHD